jgi:tRNA-dihydrouridine synthase 1
MYNANAFVNSSEYSEDNFTTCAEDRPLIVQFASHEPEVLLQAAKLVEDKCDAVDINLGCPQAIAKRGRYGAWLMEELDLLRDMVSILAKNLKIPVTCKTRIYQGPGGFERSLKLCETLVNAGASMLTLHGRTREQKGQLCGGPDWETLRRIKAHFGDRVPIIANGGIMCLDDVRRCMDYTKCDGVMTSEGILENPALFVNRIDPRTGLYRNQLDLTDEYLDIVSEYPAWHMRTVRSHIHKYLFRYIQKFPEFRDRVGEANEIEQFREICKAIREKVAEDEPSYQESWYMRYRSQDPAINPTLRHQKHTHSARISSSLLEAGDDGGGDGCSGGGEACSGGDFGMGIFNNDD